MQKQYKVSSVSIELLKWFCCEFKITIKHDKIRPDHPYLWNLCEMYYNQLHTIVWKPKTACNHLTFVQQIPKNHRNSSLGSATIANNLIVCPPVRSPFSIKYSPKPAATMPDHLGGDMRKVKVGDEKEEKEIKCE